MPEELTEDHIRNVQLLQEPLSEVLDTEAFDEFAGSHAADIAMGAPSAPQPPSPRIFDRKRRAAEVPAVQSAELEDAIEELRAARAEVTQVRRELSTTGEQASRFEQELQAMSAERELLTRRLKTLTTELNISRTSSERLRTELRKAKQKQARPAKGVSGSYGQQLFDNPEEQFRFEVHAEWAHRIPAHDKDARGLVDYVVGPDFLESLSDTRGVERSKVVAVTVEVLTGLASELNGRELHQLRTSAAGGSPTVVRADGAICWRVSLQVKTPSARRLHYWQLKDGSIELSRVVTHDDMTP